MGRNVNARCRTQLDDEAEPGLPQEIERLSCGELVKLDHYCKLTGDTRQAVYSRMKRGQWVDGKHCHMREGRRLWIDIEEVNAWVRSGETN